MTTLESIISFFTSPVFTGGLLLVKILFIFFSLFFLGGAIYFLVTTTWLKKIIVQDLVEVLTFKPYWTREFARKWNKTMKRLDTGLESEYKLAIIEGDSMLNEALEKRGYLGESLGERLEKVTEATVPNITRVREAHKICNNVIHDPDYRLILEQARKVLVVYGQALHDLHMF